MVLIRSARLVELRDAAGRQGVCNAAVGRPVMVNDEGWKVLDLFRTPATPAAAAAAARVDPRAMPRFLEVVTRFVSYGLLVEGDEDAYLFAHGRRLRDAEARGLTAPATGLFHARAKRETADFTVVGVPLDRAARVPGAAQAPAALRASCALLPSEWEPRSEAFPGFWDAATGAWRLQGARFADLGDVVLDRDDSLESSFRRIEQELDRSLSEATGLPIVLGGDHSITYPAVRSLGGGPVFLVHFDAHSDAGDFSAGDAHHHGNVVTRLLRESLVAAVLQVGVRDVAPHWRRPDDRVEQLGSYRVRAMSPEQVVARVPPDARCYVTIDIDVLDPSVAPATGAPVPGGIALPELEAIVEALALERDLVGIDLVEIAPALPGAPVTLISGLRLLVRACDGVLRRRRPSGNS